MEVVVEQPIDQSSEKQLVEKHNQYVCKVCQKEFKHHSSHSRHKKTCGKNKIFSCIICNGQFKRKDALVRHEKKHVNPSLQHLSE